MFASTTQARNGFRHPVVGDLELTFETMQNAADQSLMLFVYTAEVRSRSEEAMNLLASWSATADEAAVSQSSAKG